MATVINLADLFEKGLPPISGGVLDQSAYFIKTARILKQDDAKIRADAN
jgi:hypothetical protein